MLSGVLAFLFRHPHHENLSMLKYTWAPKSKSHEWTWVPTTPGMCAKIYTNGVSGQEALIWEMLLPTYPPPMRTHGGWSRSGNDAAMTFISSMALRDVDYSVNIDCRLNIESNVRWLVLSSRFPSSKFIQCLPRTNVSPLEFLFLSMRLQRLLSL